MCLPGSIYDVCIVMQFCVCVWAGVCVCVSVLLVNHNGGDYSLKVNSQKCVYYGKLPNIQRIYNFGIFHLSLQYIYISANIFIYIFLYLSEYMFADAL